MAAASANINNLKIDIASARKESYGAPGLNPIVKHTNIEEDLKRRDFSINAIAFELTKQEIYDFFDGIKHIKEKELRILFTEGKILNAAAANKPTITIKLLNEYSRYKRKKIYRC